MKISIFGISYATINIIESIENFSDQIDDRFSKKKFDEECPLNLEGDFDSSKFENNVDL